MCSKHKKHRLAQIKADLYKSTKELFRDDAAEVQNDLANKAEQALAHEETKKDEPRSKVSKRTESVLTSTTTDVNTIHIEINDNNDKNNINYYDNDYDDEDYDYDSDKD